MNFEKLTPTLTFVKPTQYANSSLFSLIKTESSYFKAYLKIFQRDSDFEISGLAISEKVSDVKTVATDLIQSIYVQIKRHQMFYIVAL